MVQKRGSEGGLKAPAMSIHRRVSILSIANMLLQFFVRTQARVRHLIINAIMTPIFLGDFLSLLHGKEQFFSCATSAGSICFPACHFPMPRSSACSGLACLSACLRRLVHRNLIDRCAPAPKTLLLTVVFLVLCVLQFGAGCAEVRSEVRLTPASPAQAMRSGGSSPPSPRSAMATAIW